MLKSLARCKGYKIVSRITALWELQKCLLSLFPARISSCSDPVEQPPPEPLRGNFYQPVQHLGRGNRDDQSGDESHAGRCWVAVLSSAGGHVRGDFDAEGVDDDGLDEEVACGFVLVGCDDFTCLERKRSRTYLVIASRGGRGICCGRRSAPCWRFRGRGRSPG